MMTEEPLFTINRFSWSWGRGLESDRWALIGITSLVRMSLPASFQWPWQYEFPPFFTVQPNTDTRSKQLDAWCDLVLSYHRATKSYLLDVNEAQSSPLFYNSKINSILLFLYNVI